MRFLVKATIPVEAGNALVRDYNFGQRMGQILADLKPEAAYFAAAGGQRTIYFVVNLSEGSQIPTIAEPLWLSLHANVEMIPVMSQEDFAKAASHIEEATRKY